jgi:hypothetical protein
VAEEQCPKQNVFLGSAVNEEVRGDEQSSSGPDYAILITAD